MEKIIQELLKFNAKGAYESNWIPTGWNQENWFLKPAPGKGPAIFAWDTALRYNSEKLAFVRNRLDDVDRARVLKNIVGHLLADAHSQREKLNRIIRFVQQNMIHPLVEQPMEPDAAMTFHHDCHPETVQAEPYPEDLQMDWLKQAFAEARLFGSYLGVWCNPLRQKFSGDWGIRGMVSDALELLLLHEGRCGSQALVFVRLALLAGFRARLVQVRCHRVAEVLVNGQWILADPDIWAEGFIPTTANGFPVTIDWCSNHPETVDSWPARYDAQPSYSGYFVPETVEQKNRYLRVSRNRPAFDHFLGKCVEQIDSVIASGCTICFGGGDLAVQCYQGLVSKAELNELLGHLREYNRHGRQNGVMMLSYLCATSIAPLNGIQNFTKNWQEHFLNRSDDFNPEKMLQQDIHGNNLPSWYGEPYLPADTWNPFWRQYQKYIIKLVIESGHDGVFYDNPTVHPQGNYSYWAMQAWRQFLLDNNVPVDKTEISDLRQLTLKYPQLWKRFRTIAATDFLREIRDYGRSLRADFLLTCNNSLNTWESFYSQPRGYGYTIYEMSKNEDCIVVEDLNSQPRRQGQAFVSYASTLRLIPAIARDLPLIISINDSYNYFTPPNQRNLAVAECTAHDAVYMVWACWDEQYRSVMEKSVKKYYDFITRYADLFKDTTSFSDVLLIWPYNNWLKMNVCATADLARELSAHNIQYDVVIEENLTAEKLFQYSKIIYAALEDDLNSDTNDLIKKYINSGGSVFSLLPKVEMVVSGLSVDLLCPGYSSKVICDGRHFSTEDYEKEKLSIAAHRNIGDPDNTFMSISHEGEHFVSREWPNPQTIGKIVIWWADRQMWPERYMLQAGNDEGNWINVMPQNESGQMAEQSWHKAQSQREEFLFDPPLETNKISILQDKLGGGENAQGVFAIQQIEVYPPGSQENIARIPDRPQSPEFQNFVKRCSESSLVIENQPGVRGSIRKTKNCFVLHLYNLDVARHDDYHDSVTPAKSIRIKWMLPDTVKMTSHLRCLTPDQSPEEFQIPCSFRNNGKSVEISFTIPQLYLWTLITVTNA